MHFKEDVYGIRTDLRFIRNKAGKEVDFCIVQDDIVSHLIEVKYSDNTVSSSLKYFQKKIQPTSCIQLVTQINRSFLTTDQIWVTNMEEWLKTVTI